MEKNKLQTEICVGIDFNTSNYCVGVYIKGSVKIVPNKIGDTITPSIILFKRDLKDGESKEKIFVGEEVLYEPIDDIKHLIYGIKSLIGLDYKQFCDSGFNKSLNYLVKNVDGQPKIEIDYNVKNEENVEKKYYTAIEIISYIFKKIVRNTEDFIIETLEQKDIKIKNIVFTVPTQYTDKQKNGILQAAKLAGIENPKVIIEPIAVALAYEIGKDLTRVENEIFTSTNLEK
jgi:molecular chaperone DnaK (HSP70)